MRFVANNLAFAAASLFLTGVAHADASVWERDSAWLGSATSIPSSSATERRVRYRRFRPFLFEVTARVGETLFAVF